MARARHRTAATRSRPRRMRARRHAASRSLRNNFTQRFFRTAGKASSLELVIVTSEVPYAYVHPFAQLDRARHPRGKGCAQARKGGAGARKEMRRRDQAALLDFGRL